MSNGLKTKLAQKNGDLAGSGVSRLKEEIESLKGELAQRCSSEHIEVSISQLETIELLSSLFPIRDETLVQIKQSIEKRGYDPSQPLVVLKDKNIVIDGHTRLQACKDLGLKTVPVYYAEFSDNDLLYSTISYQTHRRNLSDGDIFIAIKSLLASSEEQPIPGTGKTRERISNLLSTSVTKTQRCMTVVDKGSPELHAKVQSNEVSINKAYQQVMKAESRKVHDVIFKELSGPGNTIVNISPTVKLTLEGNIIYHDKTPLVTLHFEALNERSVPDKFTAQLIHMLQSYLNQTK